jgi:hypothetical protein
MRAQTAETEPSRLFEGALSVWTRDSKPTVWAAARMQLGGTYLENSAGDRKRNLERR